jgi:hypothetical protein
VAGVSKTQLNRYRDGDVKGAPPLRVVKREEEPELFEGTPRRVGAHPSQWFDLEDAANIYRWHETERSQPKTSAVRDRAGEPGSALLEDLTAEDVDTARAVAFLREVPVSEVISSELARALRRLRQVPEVQATLAALERYRRDGEPALDGDEAG